MQEVYLTFDDGPYEPYTSQILEILKKYNVKATFFLCGKNVLKYPEAVKKIFKEGHQIGNHTYNHSLLKIFLSPLVLLSHEIERTQKAINDVAGETPKFFRPPFGHGDLILNFKAKKIGLKKILFDSVGYDWKSISPEIIAKNVFKSAKKGSIILLHDGNGTLERDSREATVKALPLIIEGLKNEGFEFASLQ